jgi:uncharacterized protein YijF (DUF1287 family)
MAIREYSAVMSENKPFKRMIAHELSARVLCVVLAFTVICVSGCSTENVKTGKQGKLPGQDSAIAPEEVPKSQVYTLKAAVNLRSGPGTNSLTLELLDQNQTLGVLAREGDWMRVKTAAGTKGYVHKDMVSDTWIKVHKKERRLYLLKQDTVVKTCRIGLCPDNPLGDKCRMGDGATPEGRFFICSMDGDPARLKYGPRSMLLSYPNKEDARRGFKQGLITYQTYLETLQALKDGRAPSQKTALGGQIRIHGSGGKFDWTKGCVGLEDWDVIAVFKMVSRGTRVDIYKSAQQDRELNSPAYLSQQLLAEAKKQAAGPARYALQSSALIQSDYPAGARIVSPPATADALLRIMRAAGIDLQALINEDLALSPWRYHYCAKQNKEKERLQPCHINTYLSYRALVIPVSAGTSYVKYLQPGDIVVMGSASGTGGRNDSIGIIDDTRSSSGLPRLITLWQQDGRITLTDLPGRNLSEVRYCFRMTHPFDYQ